MIKINNLNYKYSSKSEDYNLKNLNLYIKKGEFVVLCGESGCGKTTVTRLINGLIPHLYEGEITGEVYVNSRNVKDVELSEMASTCGSVFQNPKSQFFNTDTTGELAFGCENLNLSKLDTGKRLLNTIENLSLEKFVDRNIFKLSGGEKQQVACGSIYATDPEIYILDEPSSNMDAGAIVRFRRILKTLKEKGKTVVITEHRLYFLMDLADRFLYFVKGELKESFTSEELRKLSPEQLTLRGFRTTNLELLKSTNIKIDKKDRKFNLKNILCKRNGKITLDIPELTLPSKSIIALIGENGAGKSTFAEVFAGILKAKGSISYNDTKLKARVRIEKSYMVMQDVNRQLFSNTVENEIVLGAKKDNINIIDELMEIMNILQFKNRHPASLSGGQKQRVAICAAVAAEKEIMLYDEPTSGLDFRSMDNLSKLILAQKERHNITMIITHDLELVLGCCTHVLHLSNGKVKDFYEVNTEGVNKLKQFFVKSRK